MAVNVTSSTRDISELNPLVQVMLNAALDKIRKKKITPLQRQSTTNGYSMQCVGFHGDEISMDQSLLKMCFREKNMMYNETNYG